MKTYKSQSTEIPIEWDLISSKTTIYHNINISPLPLKEDEPKFYESTPQSYEYDVEEYTKEEYESMRITDVELALVGIMEVLV